MNRLTLRQKKWLLSLHLIFVAIMFGVTIGFLILSITGLSTNDEDILKAVYTSMNILAETSIRASTIGTVVTGILLSVLTNWGLFKYYWIIVKEILTILSIGLGIVGMYYWSLKAVTIISAEGIHAQQNAMFIVNSQQLLIGIILQIISLAAMIIISVFKPWGQRK